MIDLSAVNVEDLLKRLDMGEPRPASGGRELHASCFGPEHSDGGSFYINVDTTAWICHGCKRRGNAVSLVMEVQQVERPTAERFLRDTYGIEFSEPVGGSMVAETEARFRQVVAEPPPTPPPASWLSGVRLDWDVEWGGAQPIDPFQEYMLNRGFSPQVLTEWDIGYDYFSDRITIPVYTVDGELFGIKARDWTGQREPKYLILGDRSTPRYGFSPYEGTEVVFGLHRNRHCKTVVLCEGELNAIALAQLGVERPIASGMSYFSERHAQLIMREADEAIAFYDYGAAGSEGVWGHRAASGQYRPGIAQMLEPHMRVRVVEAPPEDPAKLLELGRGDEALSRIDSALSTVALSVPFV